MGAGPSKAGDTQRIGRVLQHQRVVRDHRAEHDHASLVDQPAIAIDHLLVILTGQSPGIGDDQLYGGPGPHALIERVLDGQDRGIDPVGQELVEVHVDEDPDLDGLEGIALRGDPPGGGIDGDPLHGLVAGRSAPLVPRRSLAALSLQEAARAVFDRCDGTVGLGDPEVDWLGEEALDVVE